ncbi:23.2 kDa heat shock protein [Platanthera zijinensis]|uniref:23.2 kDa heat shock protein n=1 Tax=Platanthera zijinensis TaxID=2320716 RepID=A0AAP0G5W3_9ASPA
MEHTIATRVRRILHHLSGSEDISAQIPHLSVMNCNRAPNCMAQRFDNRTVFNGNESVSQAGVMQHASSKCDSSLQNFKCSRDSIMDSSYGKQGETFLSKKDNESPSLSNLRDAHSSKQNSASSSIESLKFSGPSQEHYVYGGAAHPSISDVDTGLVWSPRIDVLECSSNYAVIVEIPGVNINGIRVEVGDQSLTITGKRVMQQQWRHLMSSRDSNLIYHRKEILQGPYEVIWPLPKDVDRDRVSAEFVDGFLHITVPKSYKG